MLANLLKKLGNGASSLFKTLPAKITPANSTKAAAIIGSVALVAKVGQYLINKYGKKIVNDSVDEKKNEALGEIKLNVNNKLEKFIFECVFRWLVYIALIMLAYISAVAFGLRKDILVAFVILGIYSFYVVKFVWICRWLLSYYKEHGWTFNPLKIIREYFTSAILEEVHRTVNGLPLHKKLAMNFFGPKRDVIASELANCSLKSSEIRLCVITRLVMLLLGWLIYLLVYEKLFMFVVHIDFQAFWEPFVWPFYVIVKILKGGT